MSRGRATMGGQLEPASLTLTGFRSQGERRGLGACAEDDGARQNSGRSSGRAQAHDSLRFAAAIMGHPGEWVFTG
jgi:hypothetical protein